jgi:PAS domain S-box-containing protein
MRLSNAERSELEPWEAELERVNRALRVVGSTNKAITKTSDIVAWLSQICETAVEVGHFRMAWVGFAEPNEQRTIRPVAHAGFEAGYFKKVVLTWKDEPRGQSPAGIAIRTGRPSASRDIKNDPTFDPWRKEITQRNYASAIALPLSNGARTFGVLVMYDEEVDAFGTREVEILNELASDLAFGLTIVFQSSLDRQAVVEALEESQQWLRQAEQICHLAQWNRDLDNGLLTWSDELYRILGLEPQKKKYCFREFAELIHPDDRARIIKLANDVRQVRGRFHLDYRIIRPDGQVRIIHGEGEIVRDDAGRPLQSVGFIRDVTEQHLAKSALENANRSLEIKNMAMQEVLTNIESERRKIGERINKNVEEIILPLMHTLKQSATRRQQRAIEQIDDSLKEIISPFIDKMAHAVNSLTPAELRVCSYIKRGLAVKQIADLEHLSPETISAHRRNIRRKLQIAHRKINLMTYLRDVFSDTSTPGPLNQIG